MKTCFVLLSAVALSCAYSVAPYAGIYGGSNLLRTLFSRSFATGVQGAYPQVYSPEYLQGYQGVYNYFNRYPGFFGRNVFNNCVQAPEYFQHYMNYNRFPGFFGASDVFNPEYFQGFNRYAGAFGQQYYPHGFSQEDQESFYPYSMEYYSGYPHGVFSHFGQGLFNREFFGNQYNAGFPFNRSFNNYFQGQQYQQVY